MQCAEPAQKYWKQPNVKSCINEIKKKLKLVNEVQLIAPTQSGKSDIIINLINKVATQPEECLKKYGFKQIVIIICASDLDLKRDLTNKISNHLPNAIEEIVYIHHLPEICNIMDDRDRKFRWKALKQDSLIIFDENHCDVLDDQTVAKFRKEINISADNWTNKSVKVLNISATPYEQLYVEMPHVRLEPSDGYYGFMDMIENGKMRASMDLTDEDNVKQLFSADKLYTKKCYVIIRINYHAKKQKIIKENIDDFFKAKQISIKKITYDMEDKNDINEVLQKVPNEFTIIYIKNKLRKGKSIYKKYILMVHDSFKSDVASTAVQSLAGRMTGYNGNREAIIYCDIKKINEHNEWVANNYAKEHTPKSHYIDGDGLKDEHISKAIYNK